MLRSTKDIHYACNFRGPEAPEIAELPEVQFDAVPYRKLFRWSWYVVSAAFGWFLLDLTLTVSFILLSQYNVQVLATVVSGLGRSFVGTEEAAANAVTASSGGFLAAFLPSTLQTAAITFAIIAVLIILLKFLEKIVMTWSNSLMLARLQQRLHDKLLNLGPGYHQSHELGETLLIVTRFASEIQPLLRDLMSFPVIKGHRPGDGDDFFNQQSGGRGENAAVDSNDPAGFNHHFASGRVAAVHKVAAGLPKGAEQ